MPAPTSRIPFGSRPILAGGVIHKKYMLDGLHVINKSGSAIAADKLVAVVGYDTTSGYPKVVLADANNSQHKMIYVALDSIANNAEGHVYKGGASAANLNTNSASAVGDPVYLSETAGGFTHTAPTTGDASVIPVGWVTTKSATVGEIDWYIFPAEKVGAGSFNGIGFSSGGAVTQITSASTGVTLNQKAGQITTVALTTAAGAEERFTVTNSFVAATDVVVLSSTYNGAGTPAFAVTNVTAGAFDIVITNLHAANAFNALMVINFVVIKSAAA